MSFSSWSGPEAYILPLFIYLTNIYQVPTMGQAGIIVVVEEIPVNKIPTFKNGNGGIIVDNKQVCNAICSMFYFSFL